MNNGNIGSNLSGSTGDSSSGNHSTGNDTIARLYQLFLQHPCIQTDTRKLKKGDLFFALKGPNFNGNGFAARALELGAAYAIIDEPVSATPARASSPASPASASSPVSPATPSFPTLPASSPQPLSASSGSPGPDDRLILVPDVLDTLQQLALHHRRQFDIPFIAITGSNGKTTSKELIHAVLAAKYKVYTTEGNLNNHIGVPLTILSVKADAQFAVIEMGANHREEIASYCRYTLPTHGLITNAGKAHLEGFGGPEGVKKGKGELYDFLRSGGGKIASPASGGNVFQTGADVFPTGGGTAFVMWDYDYLREMSRGIPHIITYGTKDADYTGIAEQSEPFLSVRITGGASTGVIYTQLVGDYNLPNILAAVAVGHHFGVPDAQIHAAISGYAPSNSRSQLIEKGGNHIILDAYNANPSSMQAAIENFARLKGAGPGVSERSGGKILILGAMAELGPESLEEHRRIVDLIGKYPWQQVLLVGGDFVKIPHPWLSFDNASRAGEWLRAANLHGAYILIKGSRSMKMEEVLH